MHHGRPFTVETRAAGGAQDQPLPQQGVLQQNMYVHEKCCMPAACRRDAALACMHADLWSCSVAASCFLRKWLYRHRDIQTPTVGNSSVSLCPSLIELLSKFLHAWKVSFLRGRKCMSVFSPDLLWQRLRHVWPQAAEVGPQWGFLWVLPAGAIVVLGGSRSGWRQTFLLSVLSDFLGHSVSSWLCWFSHFRNWWLWRFLSEILVNTVDFTENHICIWKNVRMNILLQWPKCGL